MPITFSTLPAIFPWAPACWLRVAGPDAPTFLQGQFTNDLRPARNGAAVYGLWLNAKGKVLADSFVVSTQTENDFWVGSYFCPAAVIRERLESHIIADEVEIVDETGRWSALTVFGPMAVGPEQLRALGGISFPGRRVRETHAEWVFPADQAAAVRCHFLDTRELTADDIARARIAAGIAAIPADVGPGDLPNEGGLERDAISYTKGCYLGQEVMARLKSMGQVRRRLVHVSGHDAKVPVTPAALFSGARNVGEVRSAIGDGESGWRGLAMVSLLHTSSGRALAFAADGTPSVQVGDPT